MGEDSLLVAWCLGISQFKQIFFATSTPKMVDHAIEILYSPLQWLSSNLKVFIPILIITKVIWKAQ